jgi:hypothetical protein
MTADEEKILHFAEQHFDDHKQRRTRWNSRQIWNALNMTLHTHQANMHALGRHVEAIRLRQLSAYREQTSVLRSMTVVLTANSRLLDWALKGSLLRGFHCRPVGFG